MSDTTLQVAAHEAGHENAFRAYGTRSSRMVLKGDSGYVHAPVPQKNASPDQVAGYQVGCMAGAAAAKEYLNRTGEKPIGAERESKSDLQAAKEMLDRPGAISLEEARQRAQTHVSKNYGSIARRANTAARRYDGRSRSNER